jgi:hypothetical protein
MEIMELLVLSLGVLQCDVNLELYISNVLKKKWRLVVVLNHNVRKMLEVKRLKLIRVRGWNPYNTTNGG